MFADMGCKATHVGDNGMGLALKLAINTNLAVQMQALSEGVVLAEKAGIPRDVALDVFLHSAVASPMYGAPARGPFMAHLPQPAWFSCTIIQDMELALSLSRQVRHEKEGRRNVKEY